MIAENSNFLEKNGFMKIFTILDDYLSELIILRNNIIQEINTQKEILIEINDKILKNEIVLIDDLIFNNDKSSILLRKYNFINGCIRQINNIFQESIEINKNMTNKLFKRILIFYSKKEEYEFCVVIQKFIELLSQ